MSEGPAGGGPTVRRMLVGAHLRRLRLQHDRSREQAGEAIRASAWKIHRLENGQVGFKERDVIDLLRFYGVTDLQEIAAVVTMAREANEPGWWQRYSDILASWFRTYVDLEAAATLIRAYEGQLIPGLLQTEEYVRAVIRGAQLDETPESMEHRVALRMTRQQLLERSDPPPPRLWVVVDEAALRRPVGDAKVMRAQLERLSEAAALPNVTLQVLPFGAGAHPAMSGAFSILRFADQDLPDLVYVEHLSGALYLDKREDVDLYLNAFGAVGIRARPPSETVGILDKALKDSYS
jgi:hypothetical protein